MNNPFDIFKSPKSELGKKSLYDMAYNPTKLFSISREDQRRELNVPKKLPFYGFDLWNHYEVSWLNAKGKPIVALAEIRYDCPSPNIIESKSMKLYFNSFNNTRFNSCAEVEVLMERDLTLKVGSKAKINLVPLNQIKQLEFAINLPGICLDDLDIECSEYKVNSSYLVAKDNLVEEVFYSNLLKSNCLVTGQPDWGSVQIAYQGPQIDPEGLLKYLITFRNHNEFHEQCIERIFMDILRICKPRKLSVYGRYTRRGGLDINPYRSTNNDFAMVPNRRLARQ